MSRQLSALLCHILHAVSVLVVLEFIEGVIDAQLLLVAAAAVELHDAPEDNTDKGQEQEIDWKRSRHIPVCHSL